MFDKIMERHLQQALQFDRVSFEACDLSDHWSHRHGQVGVVSLLGDGAQVADQSVGSIRSIFPVDLLGHFWAFFGYLHF